MQQNIMYLSEQPSRLRETAPSRTFFEKSVACRIPLDWMISWLNVIRMRSALKAKPHRWNSTCNNLMFITNQAFILGDLVPFRRVFEKSVARRIPLDWMINRLNRLETRSKREAKPRRQIPKRNKIHPLFSDKHSH
jgi:hypothetical protein